MVEISVNDFSSFREVGIYGHYSFNKAIIKDGMDKVKLNKNQDLSKMISKKCCVDSMGLHLGYTTDKHIDIVELFGRDIFLYERSINILKFVKKRAPLLYADWISFFSTHPDRTDDYEEKTFNLRKRTYVLLKKKGNHNCKKNEKNMDRLRRSLNQNTSTTEQA